MAQQTTHRDITGMIFAAGLGTRLKPLTDTMPKALVPVGGQTLLEIVLDRLATLQPREVVVNVHHFSEQIISYLQQRQTRWPFVRISDESALLLDTGGGLKHAFPQGSDTPVLIHNVDILNNAQLDHLLRPVAADEVDAVLLVSERTTQRYLLFDDAMRLVGWINVQTGEVRTPHPNLDVNACRKLAFAGIHAVGGGVFRAMKNWPVRFGIMDFYIKECRNLRIQGFIQPGLQLMDVGKVDTLVQAEEFLKTIQHN